MILAFDGSSIDGSLYTGVVRLAGRSPSWLDTLVSSWSTYGLGLFAVLLALAWWRARRTGPHAAVLALAAPVIVALAYAANTVVKLLVHEDRPCRSLRAVTLEACPAPHDWSFPSNHAAIAAAAAVVLLFVSRRIGAVAVLAAVAMAASRVWVGAHYPHDVAAGALVGTFVALALVLPLRRHAHAVPRRRAAVSVRPLGASRGK
ncbi:phosphatase PAP2 family protein [Streptomyces olivaceiscleroticus]|uniref:Phosphatase PAP2 family protein n=1 Tax=Streptomyces olivaceiscleroticus TaxID=68245 RepID=A0ABP3JWJ4_9ACTN